MTQQGSKENRRSARIPVSKGVWVAWQLPKGKRNVSRVQDVSAGGVFIATNANVPVDAVVEMLFALPEGETRVQGVVRYADPTRGIGVEFTGMGAGDRARLREMLRRLSR
ncbi:MAG TPA: PilZ domain-containing protein [Verrucomicrobiae bacterium]|nr:PilZ domain-containing protein [Verrucomicrobiae bacterium]